MNNDDAMYDRSSGARGKLTCVDCGRTVEFPEGASVFFEGYHCSKCTGRGGIEYQGRDSMG